MILPLGVIGTAAAATAISATTILLSSATISNMFEMYSLVQDYNKKKISTPDLHCHGNSDSNCIFWASAEEAREELRKMKRRELINLFLNCEAPSNFLENIVSSEKTKTAALMDEMDSSQWEYYDGLLLDNGPILTPVTNFITNTLFGQKNEWLGKAYSSKRTTNSSSPSSYVSRIGQNRFKIGKKNISTNGQSSRHGEILNRKFDYFVSQSALSFLSSSSHHNTKNDDIGNNSLIQKYAPYCTPASISPSSFLSFLMSFVWKGMVDELRVVPIPYSASENNNEYTDRKQDMNDQKEVLLIGMGYFTWSGGILNSAPFCLIAQKR